MGKESKGFVDLYDQVFEMYSAKTRFYEWILNQGNPYDFQTGQICLAPVWYEKKHRWYFIQDNYDPINEENSTWKARIYQGINSMKQVSEPFVKKHFDLEIGENLIATHGKDRPVILIKYYESDWPNPHNVLHYSKTWLCLPIFTYKNRHNQEYVLRDQRFKNPDRIYMPSSYGGNPGLEKESVIQLQAIQMVNKNYLVPVTLLCRKQEPYMKRPFRVSPLGLKIIMYHFIKNLNLFDFFLKNNSKKVEEEIENDYFLFVEYINEYIDKALKNVK